MKLWGAIRWLNERRALTPLSYVGLLRVMPSPFADLSGIKLLIVDDNADSLELLEAVFRSCGASTVAARNVATALAYLSTTRFDVLVVDLAMPDRDGLDLIQAVRSSKGLASAATIPAIALTGFYEQYADAARAAGFDAFLQKPVNLDLICAKVRELADSRRA